MLQIMELLGQSLWDVCNVPARNCLSEAYVACVAVEALAILQGMHEKGYATCPLKVLGVMFPSSLCRSELYGRPQLQHGSDRMAWLPWSCKLCSLVLQDCCCAGDRQVGCRSELGAVLSWAVLCSQGKAANGHQSSRLSWLQAVMYMLWIPAACSSKA